MYFNFIFFLELTLKNADEKRFKVNEIYTS